MQTIGRLLRRQACHGILVSDAVRSGGEVANTVAAVAGGGLPVAGNAPSLDQFRV